MVKGIGQAFNQVTNILGGTPKNLTSDTYGTTGTAEGQKAGQWGLDQYKGMMDPTAYGGNVPGAQGPNAAQNQQYNMLTGMQSRYGAPGGYQGMYQNLGGANAQQISAMNRRGGPDAGYTDPYTGQLIAGVDQDMKTAMQMAANTEGDLAQQYSSGGPSSVRSGLERFGAMGDIGLKAAQMKKGIRSDAFTKGMGWQRDDSRDRASDITAMNQANLGFGNMNMNAARGDISNQMNMSNAFGQYGQNQQNRQDMADTFNYGEFNRMQNWKPAMMDRYMAGVSGTPWQQQNRQRETGSGPSDLHNLIGTGIQAYGTYKMATFGGGGTCIPKGTMIDMADGDKVPIEKIEAGDLVIGMDGRKTEVQQIHQYKQTPNAKFVTVTFDNGSKVNCSHDHMINNKRARNYILNDKIGSHKVTDVVFYMGVKRSYDIITTTGGYRIEGIPVNTMIPEMAEKSLEQMYRLNKKAA
tara:strand:+ start:3346 stop:4743 length:1398 start_codon:yes stop_codon:yes gene_type:complete